MVLVLTPSAMDSLLAELREVAVSGTADEESAGLASMGSWDTRQLLLADLRSRATNWWPVDGPEVSVTKAMDGKGARLATWLASMGRDGFGRERAVTRLAVEPGPDADRLMALRVDDPVELVRVRAWKALESRFSGAQAQVVVPVLVRLSARWRAAEAITRYASMFRQRQAAPLWSVLLNHTDREARRWAFAAAFREGGFGPQQAVELLGGETDQWVAARLVAAIVGSGDVSVLGQLLASRHAPARAAAVSALPDAALGNDAIESALFDRAARVRAAARYRASLRGIPAGPLYRRAWEERHDPRALSGAAECGEQFELVDLRAYLSDPDPRVRSTAVELLGVRQLEVQDAQRLFALLDDTNPGPASRAVRALVGSDSLWSYQQAVSLWDSADTAKRSRVWRLLSGRGGWDRVRADLLAASDTDLGVSGLGRADLEAWSQFAAARMWRAPTDEQLGDLRSFLPTAGIRHELRQAIEFRAGLPVTPRPRQGWDHVDAVVLVALRRTGGLLRTWMELPELIGAIDADTHEILAHATLNRSLGRLNAAGLVAVKPQDAFKLTPEGRQLLGSRHGSPASQTVAAARSSTSATFPYRTGSSTPRSTPVLSLPTAAVWASRRDQPKRACDASRSTAASACRASSGRMGRED